MENLQTFKYIDTGSQYFFTEIQSTCINVPTRMPCLQTITGQHKWVYYAIQFAGPAMFANWPTYIITAHYIMNTSENYLFVEIIGFSSRLFIYMLRQADRQITIVTVLVSI